MTRPPAPALAFELDDARFDLPDFEGPGSDYPTVHLPVLARRLQSIRQDGVVDDVYLRWLRMRRSTGKGVFGLKPHFSHLTRLLHISSVTRLFAGARLIRIRRRDLVRQAISYYTAEATGIWSTLDAASLADVPSPDYNGVAISRYLSAILAEDEGWEQLWPKEIRGVLNMWYEDLVAETDAVCRSVCDHVGVHPSATFDLERIGLQRLSGAKADEWKRRFCAEHVELLQGLALRVTV